MFEKFKKIVDVFKAIRLHSKPVDQIQDYLEQKENFRPYFLNFLCLCLTNSYIDQIKKAKDAQLNKTGMTAVKKGINRDAHLNLLETLIQKGADPQKLMPVHITLGIFNTSIKRSSAFYYISDKNIKSSQKLELIGEVLSIFVSKFSLSQTQELLKKYKLKPSSFNQVLLFKETEELKANIQPNTITKKTSLL